MHAAPAVATARPSPSPPRLRCGPSGHPDGAPCARGRELYKARRLPVRRTLVCLPWLSSRCCAARGARRRQRRPVGRRTPPPRRRSAARESRTAHGPKRNRFRFRRRHRRHSPRVAGGDGNRDHPGAQVRGRARRHHDELRSRPWRSRDARLRFIRGAIRAKRSSPRLAARGPPAGLRDEFNAIAGELNKTFNVTTVNWQLRRAAASGR